MPLNAVYADAYALEKEKRRRNSCDTAKINLCYSLAVVKFFFESEHYLKRFLAASFFFLRLTEGFS